MSKLYTGPFALSYDLKPLRPGDTVRDMADRYAPAPGPSFTVVTVEEATVSHPDLGGRWVTVLAPDGSEAPREAHYLRKIEADGGRA